jgi:hypothetical protein
MSRCISIGGILLFGILCCAAAAAQPITLGVYFDPDQHVMGAYPEIFTPFNAYLILEDAPYDVTGVEFSLQTTHDPYHTMLVLLGFSFPQENTLHIGDPFSGIAIVYWPPLDGLANDRLLVCTLEFFLFEPCYCHDGSTMDYPIAIGPNPYSGGLYGSFAPDNELFEIIGLTSLLCPYVQPPLLWNVLVTGENEIVAAFSNRISDDSAEDESHYLVREHSSPPETLSVVSASRYSQTAARLTLERPMIDGMIYTLVTTNICGSFSCRSSEWDYIFDIEIGTLLQSYSARERDAEIVVTWSMAAALDNIGFDILREVGDVGRFTAISAPAIARDGSEFRFTDRDIEPGVSYRYRVDLVESGERRTLFVTEPVTPSAPPVTLYQNIPNPFNPSTTIRYHLTEATHVTLAIYDSGGREIARLVDADEPKGMRTCTWNGCDDDGITVSSGVYFYRLTAGKTTISKKLILLR